MTSPTFAPAQSWFAPLARFFSFTAKAAPAVDPFMPITARDLIDAANIEPEARSLAVQRLPHALHASPSNAEARAAEIIETRVRARAEIVAQKKRGILERLTEVPDPRVPLPELRRQTPVSLLDTVTGFGMVHTVLGRIEHGIVM